MFETGRKYRFTMIEAVPGDWTNVEFSATVTAINGSLVKVEGYIGPETIINTVSWHFVKAVPQQMENESSPEELEREHELSDRLREGTIE